jgi:hypothetical protein
MLGPADDSSVGTLRLNVFYESTLQAILHQHPSIISYLFSSPSILQPRLPPPFPKVLPSSMTVAHDDSNRAEIGLLKLASAEGRLQDVQQILSQHYASGLRVRLFSNVKH